MLPGELYIKIFEQLKLNDRIMMGFVSNLFNQLNNSCEYKERINLKKYYFLPKYITNVKFLSSFNIKKLNNLTHIKHLNLNDIGVKHNHFVKLKLPCLRSLSLKKVMEKYEQELISKHIKTFTELRKLSIVFIEESKYHVEFLQELSHLDSIKVGFCNCRQNIDLEKLSSIENIKEIQLVITKTTDVIHFKKFKNLKRLYLYDFKLQDLGELNIKKLKLINIYGEWTDNLDYLKGLKNLESLIMSFERKDNFHNLTKLKNLNRLKLIADYATPDLAKSFNELNNIKHLSLELMEDNDSDEMEYLIDLNNLKSLEMNIGNLGTPLPKNLKELKLHNKCDFPDEDLVEFIQETNIKRLFLYDCNKKNDINLLREQLPDVEIKIKSSY